MNLPTSTLRRFESLDSDSAANRTCEEADPVSAAPCCTSVTLEETCWVPWAPNQPAIAPIAFSNQLVELEELLRIAHSSCGLTATASFNRRMYRP
jgi:hypothetical protein